MKAVLVDAYYIEAYGYAQEERIFGENGIQFRAENCRSKEDVIRCCADADVLLAIYTCIDGEIMDSLTHCKGMVRYGVGYDIFDLEAASSRGILICNIPHYCQDEVATHCMALILATSRQLYHFSRQVKAGKWYTDPGYEMRRPSSQVLGMAGFGSIPRLMSTYAKPLGYRMIAYDPMAADEVFRVHGVERVSFEELLERSDILSCHVPLSDKTRHMFDKGAFGRMKDGVIFINTSRGGLVCEEDLVNALQSGKVLAAGLDVLEKESLDADHPFAAMDNVILTPHIAYHSSESAYDQHVQAAETAVRILRGEVPPNTVNREQLRAKGFAV